MMTLEEKFIALGADNAPGQEVRQDTRELDAIVQGKKLDGVPVDFSHGDVDAFAPTPDADGVWQGGFEFGGQQAYTEYRGAAAIRQGLADRLGRFSASSVAADTELIITPGTQGALFLALGATVTAGTKVAIVEPDYFANRKLVTFFGGEIVPIPLHYQNTSDDSGLDLARLEQAFQDGVEVMVFSNPNNPSGVIYSDEAINAIAKLAQQHNVTVIVDQLYSRLLYSGEVFTHLRACKQRPANLVTIMGPSKTESLSGFRLGVAFGTDTLIERIERLQAIVSLRAAGYNQTVLNTWFAEPDGWLADRIVQHQAIRDDLLKVFRGAGFPTATPQAGSYLFPKLPALSVPSGTFVRLLRHQAGVTVTPGSEFAPGLDDSIRLNFSQDHAAAVAAAQRIVKMVEIYQS